MIVGCGYQKHLQQKKTLFYSVGQTFKMVEMKNRQYCTRRLAKWVPLDPQPLEEAVMVMRRFYTSLKCKPDFRKRVLWIKQVAKGMDITKLWWNTLVSFLQQ